MFVRLVPIPAGLLLGGLWTPSGTHTTFLVSAALFFW